MKIKIIKRGLSEKVSEAIHTVPKDQADNIDVRAATATVRNWVDDLRIKQEGERRSIGDFFGENAALN